MNDDTTLLQRYAREGDEGAFTELVQRHVNLVWGVAQRITRDQDLARDVAQTVFCDLARKARSLPTSTILPGWLHRSASLAALKTLRTNRRRSERERLAMIEVTPPDDVDSRAANALLPYVDEALGTLPDADRDAVLLRYFGGQNYAQIGAATGISDDAAQKRVSRALEKLRAQLARRGIDVSQGAVAAGLGIASAQAAPAGLATVLSASAVGSVATTTFVSFITFMKTPILIVSSLSASVAALTVATVEHGRLQALRQENAALHGAQSSQTNGAAYQQGGISDEERLELARLRSEVATLLQTVRSQVADMAALKNGRPARAAKPLGAAAEDGVQVLTERERLARAYDYCPEDSRFGGEDVCRG